MSSYGPIGETEQEIMEERIDLDSTVITGIFYGMLAVLYASTLRHLWRQNRKEGGNTWFFIAYVNVMFALGTLYLISETWSTQAGFIDYRNFPGGPLGYATIADGFPLVYMGNVVYAMADWFADGLLLWRCVIIWRGSRLRFILILPFLMYFANIALAIVLLLQINKPTDLNPDFDSSTPYFILSLVNTLLISVIIVARILMQRHWVLRTAGDIGIHANQYVTVATMIIESAALYAVFSVAFLITFVQNSSLSDLFLPLLSQIQIIAPLMIIYRVANGRAWDPNATGTGAVSTDIQFTTATSAVTMHGVGSGDTTSPTSSVERKAHTTITFADSGSLDLKEKV